MAREPGRLWSSKALRSARVPVRILIACLAVLVPAAIGLRACLPAARATPKARYSAPRAAAPEPPVARPSGGDALPPLLLPVAGVRPAQLRDNYLEARGGNRTHEALDILAPRDTPVLAVADGTVAKLWRSVPGGITLYEFDSGGRYCYYYAHMERYARGLEEGDVLRRGDVIGYVGTSGNAPRDTPHLHFAIYRLGADRRWWEGEPLNPFPFLRGAATSD